MRQQQGLSAMLVRDPATITEWKGRLAADRDPDSRGRAARRDRADAGDTAVFVTELDEPRTEGQRLIRAPWTPRRSGSRTHTNRGVRGVTSGPEPREIRTADGPIPRRDAPCWGYRAHAGGRHGLEPGSRRYALA